MPRSNVKLLTVLQDSNMYQVRDPTSDACCSNNMLQDAVLDELNSPVFRHMLQECDVDCALQLTLCGQTPETAMMSALASVNFYIGQMELQRHLRESQLQRKFEKVQEACKKKLQEVHNGYTQVGMASFTAPLVFLGWHEQQWFLQPCLLSAMGLVQAKRKYMEIAQEKQNLEADRAELQQKYAQKAQQARKLQEMLQKAQREVEMLRSGRHSSGSGAAPGHFRTSTPPLNGGLGNNGGNMVRQGLMRSHILSCKQHHLDERATSAWL